MEKTREEEAKEFLHYFETFVNGSKIVQYRLKGSPYTKWKDIKDGTDFSYEDCEYRFKPGPYVRPFKDTNECIEEMKKHPPFGWVKRDDNGSYIYDSVNHIETECITFNWEGDLSYKEASELYHFMDGSPFGIIENE